MWWVLALAVSWAAPSPDTDPPVPEDTDTSEEASWVDLARPTRDERREDVPSRAEVAQAVDQEDEVVDADEVVDPEDPGLVVVRTRRPVHAPCRRLLTAGEARRQPARTPMGLLSAVPGLVQTWRWGPGGPAITSWRGFVSGHGADIAVELEGIPLNVPGHVGGHGLVEASALPLPLVAGVDWCSGGALATSGPQAVGGRATLRLGRPFPGWWGEVGGGTDGGGRVALMWGPRTRDAGTFVYAEVDGGEGVGTGRRWRHLRLAAGVTGSLDTVDLAAFLLAWDGGDDVAPLLREDDLLDGRIRFYGGYRSWTGRRTSRRLMLGTRLIHVAPWGGIRAVSWVGLRGWRLVDNVTGLLRDPVQGDGAEVREAGQDAGVRLELSRRWSVLGDETRLEGGLALQGWFARQRAHTVDLLAERVDDLADDRTGTVALAGWARARVGVFGWFAVQPGVRVEQVEIRRLDQSDPDAEAVRAGRFIPRPEVTLTITPSDIATLTASWGRGARPPDSRALDRLADPGHTVLDVFDSRLDVALVPWIDLAIAGFGVLAKDETLADPVLGTFLTTTDTRRAGGELSFEVRPPKVPGDVPLAIGMDLGFADARRLDTGGLIPYAPRWSGSVHAEIRRWDLSNRRVEDLFLGVGVRLNWVGRYPLPDGFTARGFSATDIRMTVDWRRWSFEVDLDNAVPWRWRQIEVFTPSRWDDTAQATDLPVRHLVAGRPFALRFAVSRRF